MLPRLLDPKEVSHILHVSLSLVYRLIQRRQLIAIRLGHALRVRQDDLETYIHTNSLDDGRNAQEFLKRRRGHL